MDNSDLSNLINHILEIQSSMEPKERVEFWEAIQSDYCWLCGREGECCCDPVFDE